MIPQVNPPPHLFDGADHLELGRRIEVVPLLTQQQTEVPRHVSASDVYAHDGVRDGKSLVDGNHVSHSVTRIQHHTSCATCCVPAWNIGHIYTLLSTPPNL